MISADHGHDYYFGRGNKLEKVTGESLRPATCIGQPDKPGKVLLHINFPFNTETLHLIYSELAFSP